MGNMYNVFICIYRNVVIYTYFKDIWVYWLYVYMLYVDYINMLII